MKRKGGWEKQKERKRVERVLSAYPTISTFFQSSSGPQEESASSDNVENTSVDEVTAYVDNESVNINANWNDIIDEGDTIILQDVGDWILPLKEHMRNYLAQSGPDFCRNKKSTFPETIRSYSNQNRFLTSAMFVSIKANKELVERDWLVYSPSLKSVYCFYCRLLFNPFAVGSSGSFPLIYNGFNDWKHPEYLDSHERSRRHINSIADLFTISKKSGRIDHKLEENCLKEIHYRTLVLKRVVSVVSFLSERSLAFRGSNELIGSPINGNFLGVIEVIAKFDPFLASHISTYGNKGRGHISYLSKNIYEEFIILMADSVLKQIVKEINVARYFSMSVDSTPDVSHADQLTVTVRYLSPDTPEPVERFLRFIHVKCAKTGENLAKIVLDFLKSHGIDISCCRGQSYDNASNMSGKYSGMQSLVLKTNSLAVWVPCAAHSLNLVGVSAVNCCIEAVTFFSFLQHLYNFFSASTHRWQVMVDTLPTGCSVVKRSSDTRWSAKADATNAFILGYSSFEAACYRLASDSDEKPETRLEAENLRKQMEYLETAMLSDLWNVILSRFNSTSKSLQSPKIELSTAVELLQGLTKFLDRLRGMFEEFEQKAIERCGNENYKRQTSRKRLRNSRLDDYVCEPLSNDSQRLDNMAPRDKFRVLTYNAIIEQLQVALQQRIAAYTTVHSRFRLIVSMDTKTDDNNLQKAANDLCCSYQTDLCDGKEFLNEFKHFVEFREARMMLQKSEIDLLSAYKLAKELEVTFPNVETALRIYLCIMISNVTGERSFSKLKLIKSYLRSTMGQDRLHSLALLSIESELVREMNFKDIIEQFASAKSRKVTIKL